MSLAERRWLRLFTLCALYVAQGIPWGFTATALPAYLTERGLDEALVNTTLAFTVLPYSFKWVWGPIIDAFTIPSLGRRRPWIVFAQAMMALTILAMIAIDVEIDLRLLAWMILIHTVFNSLQDVAVDALAVDLLDEDERGRANGLMYASKYAGGFVGGFVMATIIDWYDLTSALVVQTVILLAIMCLPLLLRERSGPPAPRPPLRDVTHALADVFTVRSALVAAFLMLGINLASGVLTAVSRTLYIEDLKWDYAHYARVTGGWGLIVGALGAAAGGFLADLFGHRRMALIGSCAMAAGWLAFGLSEPLWRTDAFVYSLAMFEPLCQSIMTVSLFAVCMDISLPRIAGSQFAAYMALSNFSTVLGFQLATTVKSVLPYAGIYVAAACVQVAVTVLVLAVDLGQTRRTLPRPPGTPVQPAGIVALLALLAVLVGFTIYSILPRLT